MMIIRFARQCRMQRCISALSSTEEQVVVTHITENSSLKASIHSISPSQPDTQISMDMASTSSSAKEFNSNVLCIAAALPFRRDGAQVVAFHFAV